ncbi:bifunctional (p)ppGpp synthetase/guanosine-3',5'-bis(diphosphate) 3'-pyrophosphohydrolase [Candidatus Sumerlaeota bacterium]|nr:bifunctional (p)ppGpp synthetase/guanosine-3',5'-bis(diphosphate) 3'-pyrophosphohydrolase [Candidatus Sumerlaeota bacterium]
MVSRALEKLPVEELFPDLNQRFEPMQVEWVRHALDLAREAHEGQRRRSGVPYIQHPIAVAQILFGLQLDAATISAALLHDTLEDTPMTRERLEEEFGSDVAAIVTGVTKIGSISGHTRRRRRVESLRNMILAMSRDIRVILVKLADRLHNMRTLRWLDPKQRVRIAGDTLEIFAPLASRLGMSLMQAELEDLALRWIHPEAYEYIAAKVSRGRAHRERMVQRLVTALEQMLEEEMVQVVEISGRPKHFHSIWSKMQRQGLSFDEVFDLIALRIITETPADCYDILGIIHSEWKPMPGRFKDYIALPKENLYKSLHTTVIAQGGEVVEIQIRTREMHRISEEGVAAHWRYKEGGAGSSDLDEKLVWLRALVDWLKDVRDPGELIEALQGEVFVDTVFCFTPQGDVIELPQGSTPIDFAYHIHSEVGHACTGARVNRRMVPLRTVLESGDIVEIITAKTGHPSRDWLDFAKTSRARNKIRQWLRTKNQEANRASGREMLLQALRARNIRISLDEVAERLAPHLRAMRLHSFDEVCSEIGFGALQISTVINRILESEPRPPRRRPTGETPPEKPPPGMTPGVTVNGVRVAGVGNTLVRFAQCCSPQPGDQIVGFVTRGRGVSVHRGSCPGLRHLLSNPENAERVVDVAWDSSAEPPKRVEIRITARDRTGLLADLTHVLSERRISILSNSSRTNRDATATLRFKIMVRSNAQLNALMEHLRRVKGVTKITRISQASA